MGLVFNPTRPPSDCDDDDPRIDEYIDEALLREAFKDYEEKEWKDGLENRMQ